MKGKLVTFPFVAFVTLKMMSPGEVMACSPAGMEISTLSGPVYCTVKLAGATWNWNAIPGLEIDAEVQAVIDDVAPMPMRISSAEKAEEVIPCARKPYDSLHAIFLQVSRIRFVWSTSSSKSKMSRETNTAANNVATLPMRRVHAKPWMLPLPSCVRTRAAMIVVTFESRIAEKARAEPVAHDCLGRLAQPRLLLHPLEDQHVRVNGHTDGEHETRDGGRG
jgi:hypothetical protein